MILCLFYSIIQRMLNSTKVQTNTIEWQLQYQALQQENQTIVQENQRLQARLEQYAEAYDNLQYQVKALLRDRFGSKSERFVDKDNLQDDLFINDKEALARLVALKKEEEKETTEIASYRRQKKKSLKDLDLPTRIEIIPVNEEDMVCACGEQKKVIRYEKKLLLHYQPAVHELIEQRREVAVCAKGCDHSVITAPAPLHILPKIKVTEELLAFLIVSKMEDRQPLYHLEKQLHERYQIDISRETMARWLIELVSKLQPLYNLIKDEIIDYDVASFDATTLQVLLEPGRLPQTKSYVYCTRGGIPGKEAVLYDYNDIEHKQYIVNWFEGFKGYIELDADPFFETLLNQEGVDSVNCNAHARRKFESIAKAAKKKGLAKEALRYFKQLYKIERQAKTENLTTEQRYQLRLEKSKPLLDELHQWLQASILKVLPQSPLGKAIQYCLNHWQGLTRYLEDGRLEFDNNGTERKIKPFVIARKNFLFAASQKGADALCMHFSLIQTAKKHGLEPYHYYVRILKEIPLCQTVEDYEKLLPWNLKASPPKE